MWRYSEILFFTPKGALLRAAHCALRRKMRTGPIMRSGLIGALKDLYDSKRALVDSQTLESDANNLLAFFSILLEADRVARLRAFEELGIALDPEIEYLFT